MVAKRRKFMLNPLDNSINPTGGANRPSDSFSPGGKADAEKFAKASKSKESEAPAEPAPSEAETESTYEYEMSGYDGKFDSIEDLKNIYIKDEDGNVYSAYDKFMENMMLDTSTQAQSNWNSLKETMRKFKPGSGG